MSLSKLVEALQICLKYGDPPYPTHCEHDVLYVCGLRHDDFSKEDLAKMEELGFTPGGVGEGFESFRYGSA